jgi:hypothetical protein
MNPSTVYRIASPRTKRHELKPKHQTASRLRPTKNRDGGLLRFVPGTDAGAGTESFTAERDHDMGGRVGGTGEGAFMTTSLCIMARATSRSPSRQCPATALMYEVVVARLGCRARIEICGR